MPIFAIFIALLFQGCESPHGIAPKERDPVVREWRSKFYEVMAASGRYRDSLRLNPESVTDGNYDRIFPEKIMDLYEWSDPDDHARLLRSQEDWANFQKSIRVLHYTYNEIYDGGAEPGSSRDDSTEIIKKNVRGNDGKLYSMGLRLDGFVEISVIDSWGESSN